MPANNKPGVDWGEVEQRVKAGESYRKIAQDLTERGTPISHVGIGKRCKREGWKPGPDSWLPKTLETKTAKAIKNPQTSVDRRLATYGLRTPENAATVLARLAEGQSEATAISGIVSPSTWKAWKRDDDDLAALIDSARRESLGKAEQAIVKAEERGDWKAALTRLQNDQRTKEHWGSGKSEGGTRINVVLNIPRAPGDDAKVIDG